MRQCVHAGDQVAAMDADVVDDALVAGAAPPSQDASSASQNADAAVTAMLGALMAQMDEIKTISARAVNNELEVEMPDKITIPEWARAWEEPATNPLRVNYPRAVPKSNFTFDFTAFRIWLKRMTSCKNDKTLVAVLGNLERVFELLDWDGKKENKYGPEAVLCAMLRDQTVIQLRDLPLMQTKFTWSKAMVSSLSHYTKHLATRCVSRTPRWPEARFRLGQLDDEILQPFKNEDSEQKAKQELAKKMRDTAALKEFPTPKKIKAAVRQAMIDLCATVRATVYGRLFL